MPSRTVRPPQPSWTCTVCSPPVVVTASTETQLQAAIAIHNLRH